MEGKIKSVSIVMRYNDDVCEPIFVTSSSYEAACICVELTKIDNNYKFYYCSNIPEFTDSEYISEYLAKLKKEHSDEPR